MAAIHPGGVRLAISCGDPAGIGPEVTLQAVRDGLPGIALRLVGPPRVWDRAGKAVGVDPAALPDTIIVPAAESADEPPPFGTPTARTGEVALLALDRATQLVEHGNAEALVTAPLSKEAIVAAGSAHKGHTDWLAARFPEHHAVMGFVGGGLRVGLVTAHIPLADVPRAVTAEAVTKTIEVMHVALRDQFGITAPRLAVCGLNPHAGEGGLLGHEDGDRIAPGIALARGAGIDVHGPFPGDTLFTRALEGEFDAVIACYHDQGLAPIKARAMHATVNVTLGLPIIRTSPAHGTAWDLAGTGRADPTSMRAAIALAAELVRRR